MDSDKLQRAIGEDVKCPQTINERATTVGNHFFEVDLS